MLRLVQIPQARDNYAYLLVREDEDKKRAILVDSPSAPEILAWLNQNGVELLAILCTHHHADHVGANRTLREVTGCEVYGAAHDANRIPELTQEVNVGMRFSLMGLNIHVLDVRAHTRGHIAYAIETAPDEVIRHGHQGEPCVIPPTCRSPTSHGW